METTLRLASESPREQSWMKLDHEDSWKGGAQPE